MSVGDHSDLASLCEPVARIMWGKPSSETVSELRWGTRGSRVVDRAKGVWHDHERGFGGGALDLVPGATKKELLQWPPIELGNATRIGLMEGRRA